VTSLSPCPLILGQVRLSGPLTKELAWLEFGGLYRHICSILLLFMLIYATAAPFISVMTPKSFYLVLCKYNDETPRHSIENRTCTGWDVNSWILLCYSAN